MRTHLSILHHEPVNKCGECRACCTVMGVKFLKKDAYVACQHLCEKGCGIYEQRPEECQQYECLWRASAGRVDAQLRPDKIGVILEVNETPFGRALIVREVEAGVCQRSELARRYCDAIAEAFQAFILIVSDGKRQLVFPPWAEHLRGQIQARIVSWHEEQDASPNAS